MNTVSSRTFWAALSINCVALVVVSILVAAAILPDNWIVSPLYILVCSFTHRLLVRLELRLFFVVQVGTFVAFPFINWGVIAIILHYATI